MKNASRRIAVLFLVLLFTSLVGAGGMEDDPQTLWLEAKHRLEGGEIGSAGESLNRLKSLLASDPNWDPDGSFSELLVPSLTRRISLLKEAVSRLEALEGEIVSESAPPESGEDITDLRPVVWWGEKRAGRIRKELNDITGMLPDNADRGALLQSRAFNRTEKLVESSVIPRMTDAMVRRAEVLADGDERFRILKSRLDAVKRDLIDKSVSREDLERRLSRTGRNKSECQRALLSMVGAGPEYMEKYEQPDDIGDAFSALVRNRLASIRTTHSQTPMEKAVRLDEIKRLRILNESDLGIDTAKVSARLDALQEEVEDLQVVCRESDPSAGWLACCATLCRQD